MDSYILKKKERGLYNMKKKLILLTISIAMIVSVMAGCTKAPVDKVETPTPPVTDTGKEPENPDAVSSASQAPDEATFIEKISKDGNFIILTSRDLSFTEDLTVEGTFTKPNKEGKEVPTRSLAFAENGADGKIVSYSVTVPNLLIKSENTLLEYGTVIGNVYIQAEGFKTKEAKIEGNLYFATQELMDAFEKDDATIITGTTEVKEYTK